MTDLTLYADPITVNSLKTKLLLAFVPRENLDVQISPMRLHKGEHLSSAFKKINHLAKVPVLVDGQNTIIESNSILIHLSRRAGSELWPADLLQQSRILSLLFWQTGTWGGGIAPYFHRKVVLPAWGIRDKSILSDDRLNVFYQALQDLEHMLAGNLTLLGEVLSLADISFGAYFLFHNEAQLDLTGFPSIQLWLSHLESKPAWQQVYTECLPLITNTAPFPFNDNIHAYT